MTATESKMVIVRGKQVEAVALVRAAKQGDADLAAEYRRVVAEAADQMVVGWEERHDGYDGNWVCWLELRTGGETVARSSSVHSRRMTPEQHAAARREVVAAGISLGLGGATVADSRGVPMRGVTLGSYAAK